MRRDHIDRRAVLKTGGAAGLVVSLGLAGCSSGGDDGNGESGSDDGGGGGSQEGLTDLSVTTPEGNLNIMHFLHSTDENIWRDQGINLQAEVTSFGRWANALTSGQQDVGTLELNSMATLVKEGEDLVHFGPNLTQLNSIFVPPDSDIESVEDLRGARLGLPTWSSGTATYIQAMVYDQFGFDIREETDNVETDPPSLWELMTEQNEFDAMIQFTGFTVKGLANPDLVRPVFNAWEFWEEQTGYPALITPWTTTRDWLENNWDVAASILDAWGNAQTSFQDNAEQVVSQYGRLAGLTDKADRQQIVELANQEALTHPVEEFDADLIDSQWQLLEAMAEVGSIPEVPPREDHIYSYGTVKGNAES